MRTFAFFLVALAVPGLASAGAVSYTGSLDPNNPNDVALNTFILGFNDSVSIQTWGYGGTGSAPGGKDAAGNVIAPGGFDPYISLFFGSGPSATFVASNDDGNCPPGTASPNCADSTLTLLNLAAGVYTLAITQPFNFSFAENLGTGTLGDGFIGLESDYGNRTSAYAVDIRAEALRAAPEPASWGLLGLGLAGLLMAGRPRHFRMNKTTRTNTGGRS